MRLKAKFEAFLIRVARAIVQGRNLLRSPVVSRRDNNAMWDMGWELEAIAKRIENGYERDINNLGETP